MYINSITTQIIGIVMLVFTITLSLRNPVIDRHRTKHFIIVSSLTFTMLLMEIVETYIISIKSVELIFFHKIVVITGFIITNFITLILLGLNDNGKFSKEKFLLIPFIANIIINIAIKGINKNFSFENFPLSFRS